MSPNPYTQGAESITQAEHISPVKTGDNIQAKRSAMYVFDTASGEWKRVNTKTLGEQLTASESGIVTNTIIHGKTTAGGGSYVDVKVSPSGALQVEGDLTVSSGDYESFVDTTTDTNLVYLGKATPGTATSAASWQIKRYDKSAGHMSFADDVTTFTKTWDDRASYTY